MGILFEVGKGGSVEMRLTEYSITDFEMVTEANEELDLRHNNLTRDIVLTGVINPEVLGGDKTQEIDSVRRLANWAIIPEYLDCYKDVAYKVTDATGMVVKEEKTDSLKDFYVVEYEESFSKETGAGQYRAVLREREVKHKGLNG